MAARQSEPYMSTYLHAKGAKLGLPIAGNFELTSRCNFRCPMCYVHESEGNSQIQKQELTTEQWIDLIRQSRDEGMVFALFTGGEPFLRKDFFEIYEAAKEMGVMISINTNGSLLKGEILRRLLENPPLRVNISLYGGCPETYRNMCGQDAFAAVVEAIRALKTAGVDVRLNMSITPYNRQDVPEIYRISQELGVQIKGSAYMYPSIRVNGEQYGCGNRLTPEEAAACTVQWDQLRFTPEEFEQRTRTMQSLCAVETDQCTVDPEEGVGCRAGNTSFWLTWEGRMLPCGMMPDPTVYPLKTGFAQAWQELRAITKKITQPAQCANCPKKQICSSCAAVRITETGAFDQVPVYMCRFTEKHLELAGKALEERKENHAD